MAPKLDIAIAAFAKWSQADLEAWNGACSPGRRFDDGGALARYPEPRRRVLKAAYGRWLGFLSEQGHDRLLSGLSACHNRLLIDAFLELLQAVAPCTARAYLTDLLTVCRALAPGERFTLMHAATRHLWRTATPQTDKIGRMVPARDLYQLGIDLMQVATTRSTPLKQASLYRDGLMIALLTARPLRLANFVSIEIERHLLRCEEGYRLCFAGSEVKNRRPLDYAVPNELTEPVNIWLTNYRPLLQSRRGRWYRRETEKALWVSESGAAFSRGSHVRERIERHTLARFGKRINPHLFRDIAATSIATEIPKDVGIVRSVLGHADTRSGERFYNQARSVSVSLAYQAALDRFRSGSVPGAVA